MKFCNYMICGLISLMVVLSIFLRDHSFGVVPVGLIFILIGGAWFMAVFKRSNVGIFFLLREISGKVFVPRVEEMGYVYGAMLIFGGGLMIVGVFV